MYLFRVFHLGEQGEEIKAHLKTYGALEDAETRLNRELAEIKAKKAEAKLLSNQKRSDDVARVRDARYERMKALVDASPAPRRLMAGDEDADVEDGLGAMRLEDGSDDDD